MNHLRDRVRRSRYQVDPEAVAEAILDRIVAEAQRGDRAATVTRHRGSRRA